ncbi:MAG: HAMP domain-containing sensor histidine kinase [Turicibacter sp.]|nr:HAMP domain-containing sensor histidine kinase [Turicibacter sp.]
MRLATKIFLLLFGLFFATISLDIAAQYYFYDFAYPSYKQNQIYQLVYDIKEEVPNFERYTNDFFSYMNDLKSEYLIQYKLHSSDTSQLNLDRLTNNDIFFESTNEENVTVYHYYTKITFKGGEQWIIEISYSLQVLGEMLSVFTNYYIFIFMILAILVLFFAIWLTEHITKPLLHMKRVTANIANINFSEKCKVTSDDELEELATNINVMSDNLNKTLTQLKEANERLQDDIAREREFEQMRSNFFATISHELKTPLTIIKGIATRVKSKPMSQDDVKVQLESIVEEVDRMTMMVQDTLNYMKMENPEDVLEYSSFNFKMLIEHLNKKVEHLMGEKCLHIHLDLDDVYVEADSEQIMTAVTNLYSNAIRYTPDGDHIYVTLKRQDDKVKFEIENTGIFIPEAEIDRIWEPFYRLEKSRNRDSGGTGLGLLITSKILQMHHSKYGVMNTDRGVKFYFDLNIDPDFDE